MDRIRISQPAVILVAAAILVLSLFAVYREVNYSDFDVNVKAATLVFNLKNNRYIEITPVNDHLISILGSRTLSPFAASDSSNLSAYGIDLGPISKQYSHNTINDIGSRLIQIGRIDAHSMLLDFDIHTSYDAAKYRYYSVQVDYSGLPTVYPISRGMRLSGNGCTIDITDNQTASYDTYNQDKTILINIPYTQIMKFRISMQIICNQ